MSQERSIQPMTCPLVEPTPRRVRVKFGGQIVADSRQAMLLRQYGRGRSPAYYFPRQDIAWEALSPGNGGSPGRPHAAEKGYWTVTVKHQVAEDAAWTYEAPPAELAALQGYTSFAWDQMEAWYEEEEEVFVHPRDPYKRIDVLQSSRHVIVSIEGQVIAESRWPVLLFETFLPVRFYLPPEDVRQEWLHPSDLLTRCPYKGQATHWSLRLGDRLFENVAWSYLDPNPEVYKIKGLICFYNEKVDLVVDGETLPRPLTVWS